MKNLLSFSAISAILALSLFTGCNDDSDNSSGSSDDDTPTIDQPAKWTVSAYRTTPTKTNTAHQVGESCSGSISGCQGDKLIYCSGSQKFQALDCAAHNGTCVVLAGNDEIAKCVYADDETCGNPGLVAATCEIEKEDETDEELLVTRACIMASNGNAYMRTLETRYCSTLCSQGCKQVSCDSYDYSNPKCSGNIKTYCYENTVRTVNCETSKGTCVSASYNGQDECVWPN